jgi:hypothetical protein
VEKPHAEREAKDRKTTQADVKPRRLAGASNPGQSFGQPDPDSKKLLFHLQRHAFDEPLL